MSRSTASACLAIALLASRVAHAVPPLPTMADPTSANVHLVGVVKSIERKTVRVRECVSSRQAVLAVVPDDAGKTVYLTAGTTVWTCAGEVPPGAIGWPVAGQDDVKVGDHVELLANQIDGVAWILPNGLRGPSHPRPAAAPSPAPGHPTADATELRQAGVSAGTSVGRQPVGEGR